MDIENEICQPLQMFGLMTGHRVQGASFQSRVGVLVAADPLLPTASDSIRPRNLMHGAALKIFSSRHRELFNSDLESSRARRNAASMDVNTIVKSMINMVVARRS
ncbi:MAG TPA: hypothetical protein VN831_00085 [Bradyrhizobium sp.]|nr:hypothetical protein [Bradyrhizobium sp.]